MNERYHRTLSRANRNHRAKDHGLIVAWFRVDVGRHAHRKIRRLARILGVTRMHAVGLHDVLLSLVTESDRPDGSLEGITAADLADASEFAGAPNTLLAAYVEAELIDVAGDEMIVHDYEERSRASKDPERARTLAADRQRRLRDKRKSPESRKTSQSAPSRSVTLRHDRDSVTRNVTRNGNTNERTNERTSESKTESEEAVAAVLITPERGVELWHEVCPALAKVTKLTPKRREHFRSRLRERDNGKPRDEAWMRMYFGRIAASDFCRGINDRGWKATFDFAFRSEDIVVKVFEGEYDNREKRAPPPTSTKPRLNYLELARAEKAREQEIDAERAAAKQGDA